MRLVEDQILHAIYARRSIRDYQERPVERASLIRLLQAAMAAPSACNLQPWEFVVVTDPVTVAQVKGTIARWGNWNAPAIIVVCGCPDLIPWSGDDGRVDCAAAIENMLLAATAMGLGTVWIGGFEPAKIRATLGIPDSIVPIGLVYVGYPEEHKEPRTQYRPDAVHWDRYDASRKPQRRDDSIF